MFVVVEGDKRVSGTLFDRANVTGLAASADGLKVASTLEERRKTSGVLTRLNRSVNINRFGIAAGQKWYSYNWRRSRGHERCRLSLHEIAPLEGVRHPKLLVGAILYSVCVPRYFHEHARCTKTDVCPRLGIICIKVNHRAPQCPVKPSAQTSTRPCSRLVWQCCLSALRIAHLVHPDIVSHLHAVHRLRRDQDELPTNRTPGGLNHHGHA